VDVILSETITATRPLGASAEKEPPVADGPKNVVEFHAPDRTTGSVHTQDTNEQAEAEEEDIGIEMTKEELLKRRKEDLIF
jgi:hypothetical protein